MPTIEFGLMLAKPNHAVMDTTSPEGHILQQAWSAVTRYPTGPHWSYGGVEPGDASALWGFFAFDGVAHHEKFARMHGAEAVKNLPTILNRQEFQKHVTLEADLRPVLQAPVTEILLAYFPSSTSEAEKAAISAQAEHIIEAGLRTCADARDACCGWSVESDFPVLGRNEDVGSVLAVFVGWNSIDAAELYWEENNQGQQFEDIMQIKGALEMISYYRDFYL
ncbi:hypothetical protein CC86DRAFT_457447 [Ophiobolus disseminans]|uniref:Uncharacterized protein n=1 Tax=Ophiobolus disseminans TaxID=1469910 RepID=A0A6A6ZTP6_9PLEO|nr:hypothetical protein CC86DRAFT_457447 [Ophiobolus disseminans]